MKYWQSKPQKQSLHLSFCQRIQTKKLVMQVRFERKWLTPKSSPIFIPWEIFQLGFFLGGRGYSDLPLQNFWRISPINSSQHMQNSGNLGTKQLRSSWLPTPLFYTQNGAEYLLVGCPSWHPHRVRSKYFHFGPWERKSADTWDWTFNLPRGRQASPVGYCATKLPTPLESQYSTWLWHHSHHTLISVSH